MICRTATPKTTPNESGTESGLAEDPEVLVEYYRACPNARRLGMILEHFGPMVKRLARIAGGGGKKNRVVAREDLISAGNLGLAGAIEKYDPTRGPFKFYAYLRVKFAIIDELRRYGVSSYKFHQGVRRESLEDENLLTMDRGAELDFAEMIEHCKGFLSDQQVCVVVCHYSEGMRLGQIGKLMGMGQWRVSELHQSALDVIADCLNAA